VPKDPDLEDAPVAPEMGTIELQAYCYQQVGIEKRSKEQYKHEDPHSGRISELSKKAGWHHVVYVPPVKFCFPCVSNVHCLTIISSDHADRRALPFPF
jgi:hypothetical protein